MGNTGRVVAGRGRLEEFCARWVFWWHEGWVRVPLESQRIDAWRSSEAVKPTVCFFSWVQHEKFDNGIQGG